MQPPYGEATGRCSQNNWHSPLTTPACYIRAVGARRYRNAKVSLSRRGWGKTQKSTRRLRVHPLVLCSDESCSPTVLVAEECRYRRGCRRPMIERPPLTIQKCLSLPLAPCNASPAEVVAGNRFEAETGDPPKETHTHLFRHPLRNPCLGPPESHSCSTASRTGRLGWGGSEPTGERQQSSVLGGWHVESGLPSRNPHSSLPHLRPASFSQALV